MQLKLKDFSLSILSKIIPEIAPNVKARIVRCVICVMTDLQLRRLGPTSNESSQVNESRKRFGQWDCEDKGCDEIIRRHAAISTVYLDA